MTDFDEARDNPGSGARLDEVEQVLVRLLADGHPMSMEIVDLMLADEDDLFAEVAGALAVDLALSPADDGHRRLRDLFRSPGGVTAADCLTHNYYQEQSGLRVLYPELTTQFMLSLPFPLIVRQFGDDGTTRWLFLAETSSSAVASSLAAWMKR